MGQVRHGSATTTHAIRAAIQRSQASIAELSRALGINPGTVAKWRKRQTVEDRKTGPRKPRSTVLSEEEEAMLVAFRRHILLPLDDCLYALQPTIPHFTRSSLHRCLQRHGISRLPDVKGANRNGKSTSASRLTFSTSTLPRWNSPGLMAPFSVMKESVLHAENDEAVPNGIQAKDGRAGANWAQC